MRTQKAAQVPMTHMRKHKQVWLVNPFNSAQYLQDSFFEGPQGEFQKALAKYGIDLHTYDMAPLNEADRIISFCHYDTFSALCNRAGVPTEKRVLIAHEPRVVMPAMYTKEIQDTYAYVFTFEDGLVDGEKFFKIRYPQGQSYKSPLRPFQKRQFITLINANKYSYIEKELYTKRREAIRYFERHEPRFDLYGHGWSGKGGLTSRGQLEAAIQKNRLTQYLKDLWDTRRPYTSNRGSVPDKYVALERYAFALCFENELDTTGYITEKIFDCYFRGTVPIYLGPDNYKEELPFGSYIDMRQFSTFAALHDFLKGVTESEWTAMVKRGQHYIQSNDFKKKWTPEAVYTSLAEKLIALPYS